VYREIIFVGMIKRLTQSQELREYNNNFIEEKNKYFYHFSKYNI